MLLIEKKRDKAVAVKKNGSVPLTGICLLCAALLLMPAGCGGREKTEVVLATGTIPRDTGLLDAWIPMFEARYPYTVRVMADGSSEAIQAARDGECDLTLTNSPGEEKKLTGSYLGVNSKNVMHDDFIIAGPADDPAGIKGQEQFAPALGKIRETGSPFVSRADGDGVNVSEKTLWQSVIGEYEPEGQWYVKSGLGMGDALLLASERQAYILADKATFLVYSDRLDLEILLEAGGIQANRFVVMEVNPAAFPDVNSAGAQALSEFLTGAEAQQFLNSFGVEEYGEQLFYPDALEQED